MDSNQVNYNVTFKKNDEKYWASWLPKELGLRLVNVRKKVENLIIENEKNPQIAYYTPHGVDHFNAVESNLHHLIPAMSHKDLGEPEKFFLLASAWLHDIGMIKGLWKSDEKKSDDQIRDEHHLRSSEYISSEFYKLGVLESEISAFSNIAKYHRRRMNIEDLPKFITVTGHGQIRLRLLAAYLRLADALHADDSRAPLGSYAIMLAYNIPSKSKLHWLRIKFVSGIHVDVSNKQIVVEFKKPANIKNESDKVFLFPIIENIYKYIIQDLNDELDSVKNTLIIGGISFFLRITYTVNNVDFAENLLKDFKNTFTGYDIFDNPSSSALLKKVLKTVENILSSAIETFEYSNKDTFFNETIQKIENFFKEITDHVLPVRACHTGLKNLLERIEKKFRPITNGNLNDIENLLEWTRVQIKTSSDNGECLRDNTRKYFLEKWNEEISVTLTSKINKKGIDSGKELGEYEFERINVLLYGYSELALKTVCGLRDAIIEICNKSEHFMPARNKNDEGLRDHNKNSYTQGGYLKHIDLENQASELLNIFCCEGQPKNHTASGGRVVYHDGITYAKALNRRNFQNIYIIPDAVAGTLINNGSNQCGYPAIDIIIVGANGFTDKRFVHSAGHASIIGCALIAKEQGKKEKKNFPKEANSKIKPLIILALITDKYSQADFKPALRSDIKSRNNIKDNIVEHHGWNFKYQFLNEKFEPRIQTFFSYDTKVRDDLKKLKNISFYNPRRDDILIKFVDIVITEKDFMENREFNLENPANILLKRIYELSPTPIPHPGRLIFDGTKLGNVTFKRLSDCSSVMKFG